VIREVRGIIKLADNLGNMISATNPLPVSATFSGSISSNQGTPNTIANSWPVEVTDGTNVLGTPTHPLRIDPTGTTTQPISGTVAVAGIVTVTGTLTTTPSSTPQLVQRDDAQYDDDGIPYVNPNVPGADIATGDKQSQELSLLTQILAGIPIIGAVTANQGTSPWVDNVSQFGGNPVITGTGLSGVGIPRVTVSSDSAVFAKLQDSSGTGITSQANGAQRALDVGIDVAGVQVDPRAIRALTSADIVTVVQALGVNLHVDVDNFPIPEPISLPSTPVVVQRDDAQYDDDGIPYVNPNVPAADVATGDRQQQEINLLQQMITSGVAINNPVLTVTGTVTAIQSVGTNLHVNVDNLTGVNFVTPQAVPTLVQRDDVQYDDDGFPYVNTNVPGADVATGDKQSQEITLLAQIATGLPVTIPPITGSVTVTSVPLPSNAAIEGTGNLQKLTDLTEAILLELKVHSTMIGSLYEAKTEDPEQLRSDLNLTLN